MNSKAVCPSPAILDYSFPASERALAIGSIAMGELQKLVEDGVLYIVLTQAMTGFVEMFDWQKVVSYPALMDIYNLTTQWLLQPNRRIVIADCAAIKLAPPHPVPTGCDQLGLVEEWQEETDALLEAHDRIEPARFFIGVACDKAFAGEQISYYEPPVRERHFPLVGPASLGSLDDFEVWDIDPNLHNQSVRAADVRRHLYVLNGKIPNSAVGSHFHVTFPGGNRSWPFDPNVDPQPDRFISEIAQIISLPVDVVKSVLINGKFPPKRLKLEIIPQ